MAYERFTLFADKPYGLRAGGIVLRDDEILLIRRIKPGIDYYVLPGGGLERNETVQAAIAREVFEETNQNVIVDHILYHLDFIGDSDQYFGLCHWQNSGEVKLNGEEANSHRDDNQYHPQWFKLANLPQIDLLPEIIKDWLTADLAEIWNGKSPHRYARLDFQRQSRR